MTFEATTAHVEFIRMFSDQRFTEDDAWAVFKAGWDACLQNTHKQVDTLSTDCPPCNNHCKQGRECPNRYRVSPNQKS